MHELHLGGRRIPFLMGSYARYCLSFIAARIVVVSSVCDPKGILSAFRLRLRRSDQASPAKQPKIDGYLVLISKIILFIFHYFFDDSQFRSNVVDLFPLHCLIPFLWSL
jgi:heme exporter protein D